VSQISVISINLNNARGLQRTIKSVLAQQFKDFEYIIIDGGSHDGSCDIIRIYENNINYWSSEPDGGVYDAMNKGIEKSNGEYCFFLNSGDYLVNDNVFQKVFEKNPTEDILFGNLYVCKNGKVVENAFGKEKLSFSDIYSHTIKQQATFIKRNLFTNFGLFNQNRMIVADWEFFIKTLGSGNVSYRYIKEFVSYFDNDGLSNQNPVIVKKEKGEVILENIPVMMQPDYEFLSKYKKFEKLYKNRLSFLLLRLLNKLMF
jgi:glycosyltransferase involved in cell wall biosynthesis